MNVNNCRLYNSDASQEPYPGQDKRDSWDAGKLEYHDAMIEHDHPGRHDTEFAGRT